MISRRWQLFLLGAFAVLATLLPASWLAAQFSGVRLKPGEGFLLWVLRFVPWPGAVGTLLACFSLRWLAGLLCGVSLVGVLFLMVHLGMAMYLFLPAFALWGATLVIALVPGLLAGPSGAGRA